MALRIRLASASSRRMEWLKENLPNSVEINVKPLAGEEKISEGEVSSQVTFVLEDKITRAKIQYFLERQNALDNNSISPPNIWIVGDTLVEDPNDVYTALGQPVDEISALRMLLDISGCRHLVWSATAIIDFRLEQPSFLTVILILTPNCVLDPENPCPIICPALPLIADIKTFGYSRS